jgi:threonine dehydrogenase-like Zn-dependent dehydrogenase
MRGHMKALKILEPKKTSIVDIPVPSVGEGEVLLQISRVGFCGSDLSTYVGTNTLVSYPRIPGHEIAASIVSKGDDVPLDTRTGTNVTVIPYTSCGCCAACRRQRGNACKSNKTLGVQRDGAMTEFIAVPWERIVPVEGLGIDKLVLIEPFSIGFHAIERAMVREADVVMIIGCGIVGIGAMLDARQRGATVIAVDKDDQKLKSAARLADCLMLSPNIDDLHEAILSMTDGGGPDVVVEAAGSSEAYRSAIEEVAFAGRVICVGYTNEDSRLSTRLFVQKELDIRGSRNATLADFGNVVKYLLKSTLPIDQLISRVVPLESAGEALDDWSRNRQSATRIVVRMGI